jgi:FkbM family methyltransferase
MNFSLRRILILLILIPLFFIWTRSPPPPPLPKQCPDPPQSLHSVSGCSGRNLIKLVHLIFPQAKVFMDIGMNKGFFSSACLELWSPQMNVSTPTLTQTFKVLNLRHELTRCGYCQDCKDSNHPIMSNCRNNIIQVYSFDGNERFVDGVSRARNSIMVNVENWRIELAAFTDVYKEGKTVEFIINQDELGKIVSGVSKGGEKTSIVPVMTIDQFMEREGLSHIDLLKIDTEGHDPYVIRGARETIRNNRVTVFTFEYHRLWDQEETLKRTLDESIGNGYVCYMAAEKDKMIKLTQSCWVPQYECRKFSNIWCVSLLKGQTLITIFDSMY